MLAVNDVFSDILIPYTLTYKIIKIQNRYTITTTKYPIYYRYTVYDK